MDFEFGEPGEAHDGQRPVAQFGAAMDAGYPPVPILQCTTERTIWGEEDSDHERKAKC